MLKKRSLILLLAIICNLSLTAFAHKFYRIKVSAKKYPAAAQNDLEKKLNDFMERAAAIGYTGALLIAKGNKIILEKGYGMANRAEKISFSTDTAFDIGSNVKDFTKMAILQLAGKGKINLNDPLTKYFENVPADKAVITIEQLVNHTAGFRAGSGPDEENISRTEFVKRVFAAPLLSEPGKERNYSNPGYSMLAAIIEIVTKQSFEQYIYENILKPAQMNKTGYVLPQWKTGDFAHSYMGNDDRGSTFNYPHPEDGNSWNLRGNGGMLSTLGDMYKFHLALGTEKLLSNDLKEQLFPQNKPIILVGGDGVHLFVYARDPVNKIAIIAASTVAGMNATDLNQQLLPLVQGKDYKLPPQIIKADPATLAKYEGTYKLSSGSEIRVSAAEGKLKLAGIGQEAFSLLLGYDAGISADLDKLNEHASRLADASSKEDYAPLFEAYEGRVPLEQIKMRQSGFWKQLTQRLGSFKGFKILGTTSNLSSRQPNIMVRPESNTSVRLDFEKGPAYIQYIWENGKLAGIRPLPNAATVDFLPQTAATFVNYNMTTGDTTGINFALGGDSIVKELVLGGNIRAAKIK